MHKMQRMNEVNRSDNMRYFVSYVGVRNNRRYDGDALIYTEYDPMENTENFLGYVRENIKTADEASVITIVNYKRAY